MRKAINPRIRLQFVRFQAAKTQLSSTAASQVDAVRSGLEILSNAQKTLNMLRNCYAVSPHHSSIPFLQPAVLHSC